MAVDNRALGVDVSVWQPNVDWAALKQTGLTFAFTKATEADNIIDPQFSKNWPAMKAAGLIRGAYHFFRAAKDPLKQAAFFTQTATLEAGDLPPALDVESTGGLATAPLLQAVKACLDEIQRISGQTPIIYTAPNFWNTSVAVPNAPDWAANYPLWIANYTQAASPVMPKGFTDWTFWQYFDQGKYNGISGTFDQDRYKGSTADLLAWVGAAAAPSQPAQPAQAVQPAQPAPSAADVVLGLINAYIQALNGRDFDGLVALYEPNAARTGPSGTAQGPDKIRGWYHTFLDTQYPSGAFALGDVTPNSDVSYSFGWTCHSNQGDAKALDTIGLRDGKIAYHSTGY